MRRVFLVVVLVSLIVTSTAFITLAEGPPGVYLEAASGIAECNRTGTIELALKAHGISDMYTVQLELEYDPQRLELNTESVTNSVWLEDESVYTSVMSDAQAGRLKVIISRTGKSEGISGDFDIMSLKFKTKRIGITPVKIIYLKLVNSQGEYIDISEVSGLDVNVLPNPLNVNLSGTQGSDGWYTSDVNVEIEDIDAAEIQYRLDDAPGTYTEPFNIDTCGIHTLEVTTDDGYGYIKQEEVQFKLDKIAPTAYASPEEIKWQNVDIIVTPSYTDDEGGSQVKSMWYAWSTLEGTPADWDNYTSGDLVQPEEGIWYLHMKAEDAAGNIGLYSYGPYKIDKTPPTASADPQSMDWVNTDVVISPQYADEGGSQVKSMWYAWSTLEGTPADWDNYTSGDLVQPEEGIWYLHMKVNDSADNTTVCLYGPYRIDKTKPVITNNFASEYIYLDILKLEFTAEDQASGVAATDVKINGFEFENGAEVTLIWPGRCNIEMTAADMVGNIETVVQEINVIVNADMEVDPDTINLKKKGKGTITVYIEFPQGVDVNDIIGNTIRLNGVYSPISDPKYGYVQNPVDDYDGDDNPEYMVKFKKEDIGEELIECDGNITITGSTAKYDFRGTDTVGILK